VRVVFCLRQGRSLLFMPRLPDSYAVWMGHLKTLEEAKAKYAVDVVHYTDELADVIRSLAPPCLHVLHGVNTDRCGGGRLRGRQRMDPWIAISGCVRLRYRYR
jgi:hypothetical protein